MRGYSNTFKKIFAPEPEPVNNRLSKFLNPLVRKNPLVQDDQYQDSSSQKGRKKFGNKTNLSQLDLSIDLNQNNKFEKRSQSQKNVSDFNFQQLYNPKRTPMCNKNQFTEVHSVISQMQSPKSLDQSLNKNVSRTNVSKSIDRLLKTCAQTMNQTVPQMLPVSQYALKNTEVQKPKSRKKAVLTKSLTRLNHIEPKEPRKRLGLLCQQRIEQLRNDEANKKAQWIVECKDQKERQSFDIRTMFAPCSKQDLQCNKGKKHFVLKSNIDLKEQTQIVQIEQIQPSNPQNAMDSPRFYAKAQKIQNELESTKLTFNKREETQKVKQFNETMVSEDQITQSVEAALQNCYHPAVNGLIDRQALADQIKLALKEVLNTQNVTVITKNQTKEASTSWNGQVAFGMKPKKGKIIKKTVKHKESQDFVFPSENNSVSQKSPLYQMTLQEQIDNKLRQKAIEKQREVEAEKKMIAEVRNAIIQSEKTQENKKRTIRNETQQLIKKAMDKQLLEKRKKAEEKAKDAKSGNTFMLCLQKRQERA